jgi:hypothetical protein
METLTRTFRNSDRDRVIVTVTIRTTTEVRVGTDHEPVPIGATIVSFQGELIPYRHREPVAGGQIVDEVPDNVLRNLWTRWHLNGMRSHCAHQNQLIPWDQVAPCHKTGYKAGHAWLHELIPADTVDDIRAAMGGAR